MFTIFPWVYVILSCFKQLPLNLTLGLTPKYSNDGLRKIWGAEGAVIFSSDVHQTLDFYDKI